MERVTGAERGQDRRAFAWSPPRAASRGV